MENENQENHENHEEELVERQIVIRSSTGGVRTETEYYTKEGNQVGLPWWFGND